MGPDARYIGTGTWKTDERGLAKRLKNRVPDVVC
jgi:hypothetical protein